MPQAANSLDKVKRLITTKTLSAGVGAEASRTRTSYSPVKLLRLSLKAVSRNSEPASMQKKSRLLSSKTSLLGSQADTPLSKKALDTSDFYSGEQRLQGILISLRNRDFTKFLPGRCSPWRFKELALAKDKLKNMKRSSLSSNSHSFTNLSSEQKDPVKDFSKEEQEKWKEINRQKQEREGIEPRVVRQLTK